MDSSKQFLRNPLSSELIALHNNATDSDRMSLSSESIAGQSVKKGKVKIIEFHPVRPWILFIADPLIGTVAIFDYTTSARIFECSIYYSSSDKDSSKAPNSADLSFKLSELTRRANLRSRGQLSFNFPDSNSTDTTDNLRSESGNYISKTKAYGNIRQITFADKLSIKALSACRSFTLEEDNVMNEIHGSSGKKSSLHDRSKMKIRDSNGCGVMVVCEHALIFCVTSDSGKDKSGVVTTKSSAVTVAEIMRVKIPTAGCSISCAEFIHQDTVAVALTDGQLRLWDCSHFATVRTISMSGFHGGGSIAVIKVIPRKQDIATTASSTGDHVRFVTIGSDGLAFVWEVVIQYGIIDSDVNGGPIARFRDSVGSLLVMSAPSAGVSNSSVLYDFETDTLHTCSAEKVIKVWDLSGPKSYNKRHSGQLTGSPSPMPMTRRTSARRSIFGSSLSNAVVESVDRTLQTVSCVSKAKIDRVPAAPHRYSKLLSVALLRSAYFAPNTYAVCSKSGSVGIMQKVEGSADDDTSEVSSVKSGGTDQAEKLMLIHEVHVDKLLEALSADPNMAEELKIYTIRAHSSQPHILAMGTSLGLVVISLPSLPSGSLFGIHPKWGKTSLMCIDNNSSICAVKKVTTDILFTGGSESEGVGAIQSDVVEEHNVLTGQSLATAPMHPSGSNNSLSALGAQTQSVSNSTGIWASPSTKRISVGRMKSSNNIYSSAHSIAHSSVVPSLNWGSSRAVFHPSPSGTYCAVLWPDAMTFIVLQVGHNDASQEFSFSPLQQVDKGYCIEFGWVGSESVSTESYLIKLPSYSSAPNSGKPSTLKRASISEMLFTAKKDNQVIQPPSLLLKSLSITLPNTTDLKTPQIQALQPSNKHINLSADNIVDLYSGFLLHINFKTSATLSAASAGGTSSTEGGSAPSSSYTIKPKSKKRLGRFFYLIEASRLTSIDEAAAQVRLAGASGRPGAAKSVKPRMKTATVDGEQENIGYTLMPVGPVMLAADMVRWNYNSDDPVCAILMSNSSIVNIFALFIKPVQSTVPLSNTFQNISLSAVASIDLSCSPCSSHLSVTGLFWSTQMGHFNQESSTPQGNTMLFACTATNVVACSIVRLTSEVTDNSSKKSISKSIVGYLDTICIRHTEMISTIDDRESVVRFTGINQLAFSPLAYCEVINDHTGHVFISFRDGTVKALSLVTSSLGVAFLLNDRCLSHSSETETRHALIQSALRRAVSLEPAEAERLLLMLFKRCTVGEILDTQDSINLR